MQTRLLHGQVALTAVVTFGASPESTIHSSGLTAGALVCNGTCVRDGQLDATGELQQQILIASSKPTWLESDQLLTS